jgi:hypothetical protein
MTQMAVFTAAHADDGAELLPVNHGSRAQSFISNLFFDRVLWGGWSSNSRPADYENYGPTHWAHYLHRYHGVGSPVALIAPLAHVTRSTNRSTTTTASA